MNAFEQIIAKLLEEDGYWVRSSVKINLTKQEKVNLGKPSLPRPEVDIVAYSISENIIFLLEVKSFFDSNGVYYEHVANDNEVRDGKYKLLTSHQYRDILVHRLKEDWVRSGIINDKTAVSFGLIAGKIHKNKDEDFENYFKDKGWFFWGPKDVKDKVVKLSQKGYEDDMMVITSKILSR